jgi:hypothetical protein
MRGHKGALTYEDALHLLGAGQSGVLEALNKITGLAAAGTLIATFGALDLFAVRDELFSWGSLIVGSVREHLSGVSQMDRTERIEAAHAVLVVTAFYEALSEGLLGDGDFDIRTLALTKSEQTAIMTGGRLQEGYLSVVRSLVNAPIPLPTPHRPYEVALQEIHRFYEQAARRLREFLLGFAVFSQDQRVAHVMEAALRRAASQAIRRYEIGFRHLAVDAPEFGMWTSVLDGQATRVSVSQIEAQLRLLLDAIKAMRGFSDTRAGDCLRTLATRYQSRLSRSLLDNSPATDGMRFPTLDDAYVAPSCRVGASAFRADASLEPWWSDKPTAPDTVAFVMAHAVTEHALQAPLVVLGQPGSGKSALTQILAAKMLGTNLVPVCVELRSVPVGRDVGIQDQVERSLLDTTGEHVTWPDLCRAAERMTPVVFLDGLDELLQADTVEHGDYLEQVKRFQAREAEAGRPVCVIVTARTSVADRFRYPADTIIARLEPFDVPRISQWLDEWNRVNTGRLELSSALLAPYGGLASQPLLLLMLAMYLTGESAPSDRGEPKSTAQLYDELLKGFLFREMRRHAPALGDIVVVAMVEAELERLGVIAFGMFNRRRESAGETDLDTDLEAFARERVGSAAVWPGVSRSTQDLASRFFFIYEAQATHSDGRTSRSYEFLHATFGEFLVARLAVQLSVEAAAKATESRDLPDGHRGIEAVTRLLRAILSFSALCARAPVVEFCAGLYGLLPPGVREDCRRSLGREFGDSLWLEPGATLADYRPAQVPWTVRTAAYSANLLVLLTLATGADADTATRPRGWHKPQPAVAVGADVDAAALIGPYSTDEAWRRYALFWESQLTPGEWRSLWGTLRVEAVWGDERDDKTRVEDDFWYGRRLIRVRREDGLPVTLWDTLPDFTEQVAVYEAGFPNPYESLLGNISVPADSGLGLALREAAFRCDGTWIRDVMSVIAPLWGRLGDAAMRRVCDKGVYAPALRLVTELRGARPSEHSRDLYLFALRDEWHRDRAGNFPSLQLLLELLEGDACWMKPDDVQAILLTFVESRRRKQSGEIGGHEGDYAKIVKALAHRDDVPRNVIDGLLYPFPGDDLDSLDCEFDDGLKDVRRELGFSR